MIKLKMKNKKGELILSFVVSFILIVFLIIVLIMIIPSAVNEYKRNIEYNAFCEERPNFCYCDRISCEYKTSWSSVNGFSKETTELCNLAKKLNDKKMLFEVGC